MISQGPDSSTAARIQRAIELKDLSLLMAVAEAGSFRAAAVALAIEPSAVSRRIAKMEDRLGTSLFERGRSGVRLTEAGRSFHGDAQAIVERLDSAMSFLLTAGTGGNGKVAIGVMGSLSSPFLSQLIRRFREAHSEVVLTLTEGRTHDHLVAIASRSIDLAFVLGTPQVEGYDVQPFWSEAVVAAFPSEDLRTAQARVPLMELAYDHFIVSEKFPGPEIRDYLIRTLSNISFRPRISRFQVGREALIQMVGLGFGISLVCGSEMRLAYPNVTFVPLDCEELPFSAIWSPQNDNPALRRFLSLARSLSREGRRTGAAS